MTYDVSVVMPIGPAIEHLGEQLRALAAQTFSQGFELVLSLNGADEGRVTSLVEEITWPSSIRVTMIDASDRRGPSHARNVGWRAATTAGVLFCDADDIVDEHWVARMGSALDHAPLVGGALDYARLNPASLATWGLVSTDTLAVKFGHLPFAGSCNLAARREVLEAVDGFDEALSASEDVDFCWRAQYEGFRLEMASDAVVAYRRRADLSALYAQARNDARNDPALLARHRPHGVQWTVADLAREAAGVAVALAGALFSQRSRVQLATRGGRFLGHVGALPRMLAR